MKEKQNLIIYKTDDGTVGKQKSVYLSEEGYQKAKALFEKLFCEHRKQKIDQVL